MANVERWLPVPSEARIENKGRKFMVGGSGDGRREGQKKYLLARLVFALRVELSLTFDVPSQWITCGSTFSSDKAASNF